MVAHDLGQEEFIHCKALNFMKTIVEETQVSIEVCCAYKFELVLLENKINSEYNNNNNNNNNNGCYSLHIDLHKDSVRLVSLKDSRQLCISPF